MGKRHRTAAALAALALAAAVPACARGTVSPIGGLGGSGGSAASTTVAGSTGSGGTAGSGGTGGTGGIPANGCAPSADTVLAVDKLYFGDTDWDDTVDPTAGWELFGFNLDGLLSTAQSTDLCHPAYGASTNVAYPDGPEGLDNAFGKTVLPIFLSSIPSLSSQANAALLDGDFSILIRLGALGSGADQAPVLAKVYGGAFLPVQPVFDGSDCWPATPESLTDPGDLGSAKLAFPTSTLAGNYWDSVTTGDLLLTLEIFGFQGQLTIHHARITMKLDPGHQGTDRGIIGGVLDTEELVTAINKIIGTFDESQCSSAMMMDMDTALRQASDILKDGTQNNAVDCDGISIGLGFQAKRVQMGPIGQPVPMPPDPCNP